MARKSWAIVAFGFLAIATAATVIVLITSGTDSPAATPAEPKPISRVDLMSRYAQLAPLDKSATPETMDSLANSACSKLRSGISTDKLITVGTEMFKANSTEVFRLLVSYKCPEFLKDFK